uniref:Putative ovule protein n=1 Tax=Solanum chacoense TaxID=4108 RepID=A0A0V0II62_SOLCH
MYYQETLHNNMIDQTHTIRILGCFGTRLILIHSGKSYLEVSPFPRLELGITQQQPFGTTFLRYGIVILHIFLSSLSCKQTQYSCYYYSHMTSNHKAQTTSCWQTN